nr:NAD(P)-binding domain-containing protein [uncultured Methylophaga sp.]
MDIKKVGIIGGGACGIGLGKSLIKAGIEFEIIEASSTFGGNWQPDGPASKMYKSAHLISSKRNTEFTDIRMPDDYPHYPSNKLFFQYLKDIAVQSNLHDHTRFNTEVKNIEKTGEYWTLTFHDGQVAYYHIVIIANGLLRKPVMPEYANHFTGESIHSINYKDDNICKGKRVLVVGAGNSGCDIAVDATHSAEVVYHSSRRGYHYMPKFIAGQPTQEWLMAQAPLFTDADSYWEHVKKTFKLAGFDGVDFGLPEPDHDISECHPIMNSQILYFIGHGDIQPKPDIERIEGQQVYFHDGSSVEVDLIIWASGYEPDMPFLSTTIFNWKKDLNKLFLRVVPESHDDLLFVGYLNTPSGIGNLVNTLSRFVVAYILAYQSKQPSWHTFKKIKKNSQKLDLGELRFMDSPRHAYEVDLWKYIQAINFMTAKLSVKHEPQEQRLTASVG